MKRSRIKLGLLIAFSLFTMTQWVRCASPVEAPRKTFGVSLIPIVFDEPFEREEWEREYE